MNFTWFASAYDTDDVLYRIMTLVQIAGVLILAAGVPRFFTSNDPDVAVLGYVVMRLALVGQWLRAAHGDALRRKTALRYAFGVGAVQVVWVVRLWAPDEWFVATLLPLIAVELLIPVWAERAEPTSWHPRHIAERYGLFTIIVLGEVVLAATMTVQEALDAGQKNLGLLSLAGAGLVIVFSMWWLYFSQPAPHPETSSLAAFGWGYGHYFVFAAGAAVGAGLSVAVDFNSGTSHVDARTAALALAIPVAVYLVAVWGLMVTPGRQGVITALFPACAIAVLIAGAAPASIYIIAVLLALLVLATLKLTPPVSTAA
jgi:low temperature requirement protein LtrA